MILSTQSSHLSDRLGEMAAIKVLKWASYDAIDFSMFTNLSRPEHPLSQDSYRDYARQLRQAADESGIVFNQAHAPFPTYKDGDDAYNEKTFADIIRALEIAAILGAQIVVVHPVYLPDPQEKKSLNLSLFRRLQPCCESLGLKVALENMWGRDEAGTRIIPNVCSTSESLIEYLDELDSRYFTVCLDLGHCGLVGEDAADMIRTLGKQRLLSLHVHDNNFREDTHTVPFLGQMNWQAITAALADIQYAGDLTLESDGFLKGYPDAFLPQAARFMQEIGRHLIRMIAV